MACPHLESISTASTYIRPADLELVLQQLANLKLCSQSCEADRSTFQALLLQLQFSPSTEKTVHNASTPL